MHNSAGGGGGTVSSSPPSSSSSGGNQACAACKFQRRRCSTECPLARYFPAEQNHRFINCKRLFGVSNMVRFLKEVDPNDRDDTMKSLMFEADARERDPVHGCVGIINRLKEQINKLAEDLAVTKEQLSYVIEQQQNQTTQHPHMFQHHQHFQSQVGPSPHLMGQIGQIPPQPPPPPYPIPIEQPQGFDQPQRINEELALNPVQFPDHELKSAAALFSLTSQH